MSHYNHFCFQNDSGVTRSVVVLIACCLMIISFVAGYFLSLATDTLASTADPIIGDAVRPGSVRVLQRAR
ncbi:MAG: hypothetical protein A3H70_05300 [Candidatus Komeilibacteria bacterium RIFCSPLOWO2_02_FULL_48_11]|uniref:Uncharacterized protein n=1 Tax=Candidatus Komeilibacteria bacterium RIFCSPLOWO2_02_FULL_48_11 TaxID=1798553 RepID=A0A1G2BQV9_9BACT|nr:MAG: hypothetical protein A3H70_05300 [Candidatus Komeilibacteria bacterium RIFCSPLOWO2_02_FULL_48_11]